MKISKKMDTILTYIAAATLMILIFAIPLLSAGCKTEECFKSKYKTEEAVAVLRDISTRGKSISCEYVFTVSDKTYYTYASPSSDFEQIDDAFVILYEIDNPNNNKLLFYKPIIPNNLHNLIGKISYFRREDNRNRVIIELEYYANNYKIKRLQYFPIEKAAILEKLYKEQKDVVIGISPENVRRAFLNIEESIK